MIKTTIIFFIIFNAISNYSIGSSNLRYRKSDDEYIKKFKTLISIKVNTGTNGLNYSITPQKNSLLANKDLKTGQVNYIPYNPLISGVTLNLYGILSFTYKFNSFKTGTINESNYNDFSLGYSGKWFFLDVSYNQYKNLYYSTGPNRFKIITPNFNTDLRFFNFGINNFFVFRSKRYSYNAAFNQSAIQLKSGGSFMLINFYNYNQTVSDNGLIPSEIFNYYPSLWSLSTNRQITYSLSPGYVYTFVFKKLYTALNGFVGPGWQLQRYTTLNERSFDSAIGLFTRFKVNAGINSEYFFAGVYFNSEMLRSNLKDISTRQNLYNYGLFLGARFIKSKKKS
jgi:hypothetical protein